MSRSVPAVPATRTVTLAREPEVAPGGWLTTNNGVAPEPESMRDRVGRHVSTVLGPGAGGGVYGGSGRARRSRILTADQLWTVYTRVPDVRAAIDAIVRRVATWDWLVEPKLDPSEEGYAAAEEIAQKAADFFKTPNFDGETWQEFWTKVVTDLLIFDAGAVEIAYNGVEKEVNGQMMTVPGEEFEEFVVLRGADIMPVIDQFGRVLGYQQDIFSSGVIQISGGETLESIRTGETPIFEPRQMAFFRMFPSTSTASGQPLIENIINEIITVMRSSEHSMLAFDADEIPPGILVITGVAGAAADAAKQDLKRMRGKDHKVRVVTSPDPNATGARWVELRHTPKDLEFTDVVMQVRRTIWRIFGVLPIEMGDSENVPRSVGRVQLEVGTSHLIGPILELIEGKVNSKLLKVLLGDEAEEVRFRFDREAKLSPVEQKAKSDTMVSLVGKGIISRNEARKELDLSPVAGGDTLTVDSPTGPVPLTMFVETPEEVVEPGDETPEEGDDDDAVIVAQVEGETAEVVGERVDSSGVHVHGPGCTRQSCGHDLAERAMIDQLPSEWQPRGMFKDVRTISLLPLWEVTAEYGARVSDIYAATTSEIVAIMASSYVPGELDNERASHLLNRLFGSIGRMEVQWAALTRQYYTRAAKIGRDSATDLTGRQVQADFEGFADVYWARAMGFLCQPGGLTYSLRARLSAIVAGLQNERGMPLATDVRSGIDAEIPEGAVATATVAEATTLTVESFAAERFRITNWSGRLIELANLTLTEGLGEGGTDIADGDGAQAGRATWMVEWVNVGDSSMCGTCTDLGSLGFVPIRTLPTVPGGNTECQANCRCVLVMWTEVEVLNGTAFPLSGGAP